MLSGNWSRFGGLLCADVYAQRTSWVGPRRPAARPARWHPTRASGPRTETVDVTQAAGRPAEQVARIQQMIGQLEAAAEELARQRAAAQAQLGQREVADEAEARCRPGSYGQALGIHPGCVTYRQKAQMDLWKKWVPDHLVGGSLCATAMWDPSKVRLLNCRLQQCTEWEGMHFCLSGCSR